MNCPNCGSPVKIFRDGWECGWCGDSCWTGVSVDHQPQITGELRICCSVVLPKVWASMKEELGRLVPRHAAALTPSLGHAALHQLSLSAATENRESEAKYLRDLYAFVAAEKELGAADETAARIERGEELYAEECRLSEAHFGSFWQALLDALEEEGRIPWDTDTDGFFSALADFRSWRGGGPFADAASIDLRDALQRAFHSRWEELHPEDLEVYEEDESGSIRKKDPPSA